MSKFDEMVNVFLEAAKDMQDYERDCEAFHSWLLADIRAYLGCREEDARPVLATDQPWPLDEKTETQFASYIAMSRADKSLRIKFIFQLTEITKVYQLIYFNMNASGANVTAGRVKRHIRKGNAADLRSFVEACIEEVNTGTRGVYGPPQAWREPLVQPTTPAFIAHNR